MMAKHITVDIAYAPAADVHELESVSLPIASCVADAISHSQLVRRYPDIEQLPKGVFGVRVTHETELHDGDRLEIYRPLTIDPMQKRKNRACTKRG